MKPLRPVEIIGGGLAGLSLGTALRRHGIPVVLHERGTYPRHRVCGEFIRGLDAATIATLGLAPHLARAPRHTEVTWFVRDEPLRRQCLSEPALALSRYELDARLADDFVDAGGELKLNSRAPSTPHPGRVFAHGRKVQPRSPWIGLKVHVRGLRLDRRLEMHLADEAYVGLCQLEGDVVNVCGLFRQRDGLAAQHDCLLVAYLRATGLDELADRVDGALIDLESFAAVAGLDFSATDCAPDVPLLGDACAMIPPFTGNGMAMAFESAALALPHLVEWSHHRVTWHVTAARIQEQLRKAFRVRLAVANACHPFLLHSPHQRWLATADHLGLLPVRSLTTLLS